MLYDIASPMSYVRVQDMDTESPLHKEGALDVQCQS